MVEGGVSWHFKNLLNITESNQEKIVEAGGLGSLLNLLQCSEDETIRRVAAGAVANLAMNGQAILFSSLHLIHKMGMIVSLDILTISRLWKSRGLVLALVLLL